MDLPDDLHVFRDFSGARVTIDSRPDDVLRITRGRLEPANNHEEANRIIDAEIAAWLDQIGWKAPKTSKSGAKSGPTPNTTLESKFTDKADPDTIDPVDNKTDLTSLNKPPSKLGAKEDQTGDDRADQTDDPKRVVKADDADPKLALVKDDDKPAPKPAPKVDDKADDDKSDTKADLKTNPKSDVKLDLKLDMKSDDDKPDTKRKPADG